MHAGGGNSLGTRLHVQSGVPSLHVLAENVLSVMNQKPTKLNFSIAGLSHVSEMRLCTFSLSHTPLCNRPNFICKLL